MISSKRATVGVSPLGIGIDDGRRDDATSSPSKFHRSTTIVPESITGGSIRALPVEGPQDKESSPHIPPKVLNRLTSQKKTLSRLELVKKIDESAGLIARLASFIPIAVTEEFLGRSAMLYMTKVDKEAQVQHETRFDKQTISNSCVGVMDLSGFTAFSERCCNEGAAGVEKLSLYLNTAMDRMVRAAEFFGGDILKFAGDSILVMFSERSPEGRSEYCESERGIPILAVNALLSAEMLHKAFRGDPVWKLHMGINIGPLNIIHIGGYKKRYEFIAHGECLRVACLAMDLAGHGETVVGLTVRSKLLDNDMFEFEARYEKDQSEDTKVPGLASYFVAKFRRGEPNDELFSQYRKPVLNLEQYLESASNLNRQYLRECYSSFIQKHVVGWISEGLAEKSGKSPSEIREVSTLFANLEYSTSKLIARGEEAENRDKMTSNSGSVIMQTSSMMRSSAIPHTAASIRSSQKESVVGFPGMMKKQNTVRGITEDVEIDSFSSGRGDIASSVSEKVSLDVFPSEPQKTLKRLDSSILLKSVADVDYDFGNHEDADEEDLDLKLLKELQKVFILLQQAIFSHQGMLRQFIIDDKGCVIIACFGTHGTTNIQIAQDAILTGIDMMSKMQNSSITIGIGIATGLVFCGTVGNSSRREYAVVGGSVNLAARIMKLSCKTATETKGALHIEENTFKDGVISSGAFQYEALEPVKFKGVAEPVKVYKIEPAVASKAVKSVAKRVDIVSEGTKKLTKELLDVWEIEIMKDNYLVRNSVASYEPRAKRYLVLADSGYGKTTFIRNLMDHIVESSENSESTSSLLATTCNDDNSLLPYHTIKDLVVKVVKHAMESEMKGVKFHTWLDFITHLGNRIFKNYKGNDVVAAERQSFILKAAPVLTRHFNMKLSSLVMAPLLDENKVKSSVVCSENDIEFISCKLLSVSSDNLAILIDDAHLIDEKSMMLLMKLPNWIPSSLLVLTLSSQAESLSKQLQGILQTREEGGGGSSEWEVETKKGSKTEDSPSKWEIKELLRFTATEAEKMIISEFQLSFISETIIEFIMELTKGRPSHILALFRTLLAKGFISINEGKCIGRSNDGREFDTSAAKSALDTSLGRLVITRLDCLDAQTAEVAKTASVIGTKITESFLLYLLPIGLTNKSQIASILDSLANAGFLIQIDSDINDADDVDEADEKEKVFKFESKMSRDVIYNIIPATKRQVLHRKIAQRLEMLHYDELVNVADTIARHYIEAKEIEKGLKFLEIAAKTAFEEQQHEKVIAHLKEALLIGKEAKMHEFEDGCTRNEKHAQWMVTLALCLSCLGDFETAESMRKEASVLVGDTEKVKGMTFKKQSQAIKDKRRSGVKYDGEKVDNVRTFISNRQESVKQLDRQNSLSPPTGLHRMLSNVSEKNETQTRPASSSDAALNTPRMSLTSTLHSPPPPPSNSCVIV
jgi:class 3 adenylate cyclase